MPDLKSCPLCGEKPSIIVSSRKSGGKTITVYGYVCSTSGCSWSYAYSVYDSREEAVKVWNEKCDRHELLVNSSKKLHPCACGGEARFVYEPLVGYGFWIVRCLRCQKLLSATDSMNATIEEWNRRNDDA